MGAGGDGPNKIPFFGFSLITRSKAVDPTNNKSYMKSIAWKAVYKKHFTKFIRIFDSFSFLRRVDSVV